MAEPGKKFNGGQVYATNIWIHFHQINNCTQHEKNIRKETECNQLIHVTKTKGKIEHRLLNT